MAASMKVVISGYFGIISILFGISYYLPISRESRGIIHKSLFNILIESGLVFASLFIWRQFSSVIYYIFAHHSLFKFMSKTLLCLFLAAAHFSFLTNLFFITEEPHWFARLCYACLGIFAQLGLWMAIVNILAWIIKVVGIVPKYSQRSKAIRIMVACIYASAVSMYGLHRGSQLPSVRSTNIPIKNLPKSFQNFKIVQINDIHLGPTVGKTRLQGIVNIVGALNPDAVVIVGDLTDGKVANLKTAVRPLLDIKAAYGTFYVTGNHEYMTNDVDTWFKFLQEELGVHVLHNSHMKIVSPEDNSQYFYFAGTDDVFADRIRYDGHSFDLDGALRGCDPGKAVILLAHQPIAAKRALDSKHRDIQLVLSGHTHGGQMFPISIGAWLFNPFYVGLYKYKGKYVYVSEGTVFWGIPMRIFTSMEITEIYLQAA